MDEYYQHSDIVIRFDVFKDGKKSTPISALVHIYIPDKDYLGTDKATVDGNEVRYILKGVHVERVGEYIFVCKVRIKELGVYTHIVNVDVKKLPVPTKGKE